MSDLLTHAENQAIAQDLDLPRTAFIDGKYRAGNGAKFATLNPASGDDAISMIVREPIDVVGAVLPWNFPLMMLAWKIGPALAAGCSVIVKPAEQTSMTALRIAALAHEAGLPRGVLQVLPGDGPSVGEPLDLHMDVDKGNGPFIAPVIYDVGKEDPKARDEIFGPVLAVIKVATNDEAVAVANQTDYGLAASVFTANTRNAIRAARDIRAGTVTVNRYGEGDIATPFGGYKQSGFGGRDNGVHAHDQFTELKTI
ncbi:MAG: aldehyde dehydrogenase family protein [Sedimentitalea sp.]